MSAVEIVLLVVGCLYVLGAWSFGYHAWKLRQLRRVVEREIAEMRAASDARQADHARLLALDEEERARRAG